MKRIGKAKNILLEGLWVVVRNIVCLMLGAYSFFLVTDTLLFCR